MSEKLNLSPFVYWAQNENTIFLKIDLKDAKDPNIVVEDKSISFNGLGRGAQGVEEYAFNLSLFETITPEENTTKVNEGSINIKLVKQQAGWWPRLISTPQKPTWLKIDFDKWQSEDDLLEENVNNVTEDYQDIYNELMKKELGYIKEDFRKVYMVFYNLAMLCAFLYVLLVTIITLAKHDFEPAGYQAVYPAVGHILCFVQLFQGLEVMHPIFGYVRGGALMPFVQIAGRLLVLFGNLEFEPKLQKMPAVTWLFLAWTVSDIIRYVYYLLHISTSNGALKEYCYGCAKWLRYSAWIVLYPIGFVCESVIIFRNVLYLHTHPRFYLQMPNRFNATFDYATCLRIYMLFIMLPGMYMLISHMYKARAKQFGGKEPLERMNYFAKKRN